MSKRLFVQGLLMLEYATKIIRNSYYELMNPRISILSRFHRLKAPDEAGDARLNIGRQKIH